MKKNILSSTAVNDNYTGSNQSGKAGSGQRTVFATSFIFVVLLLLVGSANTAQAQTACTQTVINEIYTQGGLAGAAYKNDYVELYNKSASPCSLTGFSLQRSPGNSNSFTSLVNFSAGTVIPAKGYLLIQFDGDALAAGAALPTPDLIVPGAALQVDGKLALVNATGSLTGSCEVEKAASIDFVGYGGANCFEGATASGAPAGTPALSIERIVTSLGVIQDTNVNSVDFALRAASPRNAASSPTSASVTVSGRVIVGRRIGVSGTRVYLTNQNGETRTAFTNSFGYYRFNDVAVGETYIFNVLSKNYMFSPQVISINEELTELNFYPEK
ncbi:MAG TPA: lamin tail domain-containing protein [Pyrinomonadaceae bacterium]|nr:lamin tail domain-containing protein [Pyrinomonadaceae bacterium]